MQPQTVSRNFWLHSRSDTTIHVYEKSLLGRTRKNMRNFFLRMRNILQPGYSSAWAPRAAVCSKKKGKKEKKNFPNKRARGAPGRRVARQGYPEKRENKNRRAASKNSYILQKC